MARFDQAGPVAVDGSMIALTSLMTFTGKLTFVTQGDSLIGTLVTDPPPYGSTVASTGTLAVTEDANSINVPLLAGHLANSFLRPCRK